MKITEPTSYFLKLVIHAFSLAWFTVCELQFIVLLRMPAVDHHSYILECRSPCSHPAHSTFTNVLLHFNIFLRFCCTSTFHGGSATFLLFTEVMSHSDLSQRFCHISTFHPGAVAFQPFIVVLLRFRCYCVSLLHWGAVAFQSFIEVLLRFNPSLRCCSVSILHWDAVAFQSFIEVLSHLNLSLLCITFPFVRTVNVPCGVPKSVSVFCSFSLLPTDILLLLVYGRV